MVDPLSITASIVGLMETFLRLRSFIGNFISAGKQRHLSIQQLNSELSLAEDIFLELRKIVEIYGTEYFEQSQLEFRILQNGLAQFCNSLRLAATELTNSPLSPTKDVMQRLAWPSQHVKIKELLQLLQSHKQNIQLALTFVQMYVFNFSL